MHFVCVHVILSVHDINLQISLLYVIIMGSKHDKGSSGGVTKDRTDKYKTLMQRAILTQMRIT